MKFKDYLRKKLITPSELSVEIGVAKATVFNWVHGRSIPYMVNLRKLVAYFGEDVLECFKEEA